MAGVTSSTASVLGGMRSSSMTWQARGECLFGRPCLRKLGIITVDRHLRASGAPLLAVDRYPDPWQALLGTSAAAVSRSRRWRRRQLWPSCPAPGGREDLSRGRFSRSRAGRCSGCCCGVRRCRRPSLFDATVMTCNPTGLTAARLEPGCAGRCFRSLPVSSPERARDSGGAASVSWRSRRGSLRDRSLRSVRRGAEGVRDAELAACFSKSPPLG